MKHPLTSYIKWSIWGFLAMTCISCAHQSKEANLMIDTETPNEEHVWSENRDVQETIAAEQSSEEQQLAEVEKDEDKAIENSETSHEASPTEAQVTSESEVLVNNEEQTLDTELADNKGEEENSKSEETVATDTSAATSVINTEDVSSDVTSMVVANNEVSRVDEGLNAPKEEKMDSQDVSVEPRREVSSEAPMEEVTPPSEVEPTVGAPAKLKTDDKSPTKKPSKRTKTWRGNDQAVVKLAPLVKPETPSFKAPEVAIVSKEELNSKPKTESSPGMNELGEENDSTPQLASVEIANFVQNHWLAVLLTSGCFVIGLFFFLRRKGGDDPQAI